MSYPEMQYKEDNNNEEIKYEKNNKIKPICPHCSKELAKVYFRKDKPELIGVVHTHFCPHCNKILGVSQRKGFWSS